MSSNERLKFSPGDKLRSFMEQESLVSGLSLAEITRQALWERYRTMAGVLPGSFVADIRSATSEPSQRQTKQRPILAPPSAAPPSADSEVQDQTTEEPISKSMQAFDAVEDLDRIDFNTVSMIDLQYQLAEGEVMLQGWARDAQVRHVRNYRAGIFDHRDPVEVLYEYDQKDGTVRGVDGDGNTYTIKDGGTKHYDFEPTFSRLAPDIKTEPNAIKAPPGLHIPIDFDDEMFSKFGTSYSYNKDGAPTYGVYKPGEEPEGVKTVD